MKDTLRHDANLGDPYACLAVAYFYQTGKELVQDIPMALRWYERAAEAGCARAHWELAKMYLAGDYVTRDLAHYIDHLKHAAELGNAEAQATLASEYSTGFLIPRDWELMYTWFLAAAEQGVLRAKFAVGYLLSKGVGVERSIPESESWFASVSLSGDAEFFLTLGMSFEYGLNMVEVDLVEAARWYKYGADMGHDKCILCWHSVLDTLDGAEHESYNVRLHRLLTTQSQKDLDAIDSDMAYADEFFEAGDEQGALKYYMKAADMGSPSAMFAVAMMHHQGIAVKRDDTKALRLLARAADAGSEDAQFYLARAYENGNMTKDQGQIIKLYSDAADNGFLAAFYYLGKYVEHPEVYVRKTHQRS